MLELYRRFVMFWFKNWWIRGYCEKQRLRNIFIRLRNSNEEYILNHDRIDFVFIVNFNTSNFIVRVYVNDKNLRNRYVHVKLLSRILN